jgi:hypothetical protein
LTRQLILSRNCRFLQVLTALQQPAERKQFICDSHVCASMLRRCCMPYKQAAAPDMQASRYAELRPPVLSCVLHGVHQRESTRVVLQCICCSRQPAVRCRHARLLCNAASHSAWPQSELKLLQQLCRRYHMTHASCGVADSTAKFKLQECAVHVGRTWRLVCASFLKKCFQAVDFAIYKLGQRLGLNSDTDMS